MYKGASNQTFYRAGTATPGFEIPGSAPEIRPFYRFSTSEKEFYFLKQIYFPKHVSIVTD